MIHVGYLTLPNDVRIPTSTASRRACAFALCHPSTLNKRVLTSSRPCSPCWGPETQGCLPEASPYSVSLSTTFSSSWRSRVFSWLCFDRAQCQRTSMTVPAPKPPALSPRWTWIWTAIRSPSRKCWPGCFLLRTLSRSRMTFLMMLKKSKISSPPTK